MVEEGFDAFLEIFVVGCWEALDGAHQTGHLAEGSAGLSAEQFQAVFTFVRYWTSWVVDGKTHLRSSSEASKKTLWNKHPTNGQTHTPSYCR